MPITIIHYWFEAGYLCLDLYGEWPWSIDAYGQKTSHITVRMLTSSALKLLAELESLRDTPSCQPE